MTAHADLDVSTIPGIYAGIKSNHGEVQADKVFRELLSRAIKELGSGQDVEKALAVLKKTAVAE